MLRTENRPARTAKVTRRLWHLPRSCADSTANVTLVLPAASLGSGTREQLHLMVENETDLHATMGRVGTRNHKRKWGDQIGINMR